MADSKKNTNKKRVLVLSGGGSKGAYQVGALKKLVEHGVVWDSVHGISVGSLNGLFISSFNKEELKDNFFKLEKIWTEVIKGNKTLYKPWLPFYLNYPASFFIGSLFSTKPLKKFLYKHYNIESIKKSLVDFNVGVTSLTDGKYELKNKNECEDIIKWVLASSSFPLAFPPQKINGKKYVDGGIRNLTPFHSAFKDCPDIIDVILTRRITDGFIEKKDFKTNVSIGLRAIEIMMDEIFINDLKINCQKNGIKINIYSPGKDLDYGVLDFNKKNILETIKLGYEETVVK